VRKIAAIAVFACGLVLVPALKSYAADAGPPADVTEVRTAEIMAWSGAHVRIEDVRVVGNYAVLEWINGQSGGMSAYHKTAGGTWKRFLHGGGALAASDLEKNGCPASIARQLIPGSPG
jgi:hypothetical protein